MVLAWKAELVGGMAAAALVRTTSAFQLCKARGQNSTVHRRGKAQIVGIGACPRSCSSRCNQWSAFSELAFVRVSILNMQCIQAACT